MRERRKGRRVMPTTGLLAFRLRSILKQDMTRYGVEFVEVVGIRSQVFKVNARNSLPSGLFTPPSLDQSKATHFSSYRLEIGGLVESSQSLSLENLCALPSRTQITRRD